MASPTVQTRLRRVLRRRRRQVEGLTLQAEESFDQNLLHRFGHLLFVRRFVAAWTLLFVLLTVGVMAQTSALGTYYKTLKPVPGGTYTEGILGDFTNANPLYATNPVDISVSRLVFSSLLTYNAQNQLVGDVAADWHVDTTGKVYTVHLKPNIRWHDGRPLTANDVAFTYHLIQSPDAQSPLNASWQNVKVQATNPVTVTFTLANPLSSFPYSLTNGIVPEHLLGKVPLSALRSAQFNTAEPVGSGPFTWKTIQVSGTTPETRQADIVLKSYADYHGSKPKLAAFVIKALHSRQAMIDNFKQGQLDAMVGLTKAPEEITKRDSLDTYSLPFTGANMVFFKTSAGVLSSQNVRQALVKAANVNQIINKLDYPAIPVREPLLMSQVGYDQTNQQFAYDPVGAAAQLQQDGWAMGAGGIRYKDGKPFSFTLTANDNAENRFVTHQLVQQWRAVGAHVTVNVEDDSDLKNAVAFHTYDALLYGIAIGVDPDIFIYWDSAQADARSGTWLNLSEYKSAVADEALEAGRTRSDPALRIIKYQPFLKAWQTEAPALGLYQPRLLYFTREPVFGLTDHAINTATDRYSNVVNWQIRTAKVADQ